MKKAGIYFDMQKIGQRQTVFIVQTDLSRYSFTAAVYPIFTQFKFGSMAPDFLLKVLIKQVDMAKKWTLILKYITDKAYYFLQSDLDRNYFPPPQKKGGVSIIE